MQLCLFVCLFVCQLFHSKMYNKVAVFPTILISGLYHEYVLWAPMRFVMPVLVFQFSVFGGKTLTSHYHTLTEFPNLCCSSVDLAAPQSQQGGLELLPAPLPPCGCVRHGLLLYHGVLCSQDLSNGREYHQHLHSSLLYLLSVTFLLHSNSNHL